MKETPVFDIIDFVFLERALLFYLEECEDVEDEEAILEKLLAKVRRNVVKYAMEREKKNPEDVTQ